MWKRWNSIHQSSSATKKDNGAQHEQSCDNYLDIYRTQCHDITVYPSVGFAGGACAGMGLLLDIRDPANPIRLDAVADTNFW